MKIRGFERRLQSVFRAKGVAEEKIDEVLESGYILHGGMVLDKMYGTKGFSSCFNVDEFVDYVQGRHKYTKLEAPIEYTVKNIDDIYEILQDKRRQRYIADGSLSFRGQTSEYTFKRKIPNPVRADDFGKEVSIFPGLFRQAGSVYSFYKDLEEKRTLEDFLHELEPNNPESHYDRYFSYDMMRTEQHYAAQTSGLDISFDIETAIFFATYKFKTNEFNRAFHEKVEVGSHRGVIYGFRFTSPSVKSTEFLISDFDFFKTLRPERVIRQNCGLPMFSEYERNIAVTDLDFVIRLDQDFDYDGLRIPEYMFPNVEEDKFYGKLLELKDRYPEDLASIVEYEGSRGGSSN
jgi:hypothetical protein